MRSNSSQIWLIGGLVAVVLVVVGYMMFKPPKDSASQTRVMDNWNQYDFSKSNQGPYGTYVLYKLLDSITFASGFELIDDTENISEELVDEPGNQNYVLVTEVYQPLDWELAELLAFVEQGNTAFISAENFSPESMLPFFRMDDMLSYPVMREGDSSMGFKVNNDVWKRGLQQYDFIFENRPVSHDWGHFFQERSLMETVVISEDEYGNMVGASLQYGDGRVILHAEPYLFSNVNMLTEAGLDYADAFLSEIPEGDIIWDEYSKSPVRFFHEDEDYQPPQDGGSDLEESMLHHIVSNPPLLMALIIAVVMGILYVFFKTKRMQAAIPPVDPRNNTSLSFVAAIADLHHRQNRHYKMALSREKVLRYELRERYRIEVENEEDMERLSGRSGVDPEIIQKIFSNFAKAKTGNYSAKDLAALYSLIKKFNDKRL